MRAYQYALLFLAIFVPLIVALYIQSGNTTPALHTGLFEDIVATCYPAGKQPQAYDFQLVDQYNQTVRLSDLWSSPVLITFTYTYCPDVCPLIHTVLNKSLPGLERYVGHVLDVTLDPQRDNVTRLYYYSTANKYDWLFLTGNEDELSAIWSAYGVYRQVQYVNGQPYIVHSVVFVVVRDGKILGVVRGLPTPDMLVQYVAEFVQGKC